MHLIDSRRMREIDRRTIEEFGIEGALLMERAGRAVALLTADLAGRLPTQPVSIRLLAGKGNNGGDAFVAARYLHQWGFASTVLLACSRTELQGDALHHFERMTHAGVPAEDLTEPEDWQKLPEPGDKTTRILVDGLLGTGIAGEPREPVASAIAALNADGARCPVLAIDTPSGLNTDTGEAPAVCVAADLTATMAFPKTGFAAESARPYLGEVQVIDIGVPPTLAADVQSDVEIIAQPDIAALFPRRATDAHKGSYGHLLIIAGAVGYSGAASLAADAAVRSGPGLVTVLTPACVAAPVASRVPECMVLPGPETASGSLRADALDNLPRDLNSFDAVLCGPGLTPHTDTEALVRHILEAAALPLLLDADGLNVCAAHPEWIARCGGRVVLTPHAGELARPLGEDG